jgi:hypothetical protein
MIWRSARVVLGRRGAYDDHAAWAAWAAGRPPWVEEADPGLETIERTSHVLDLGLPHPRFEH